MEGWWQKKPDSFAATPPKTFETPMFLERISLAEKKHLNITVTQKPFEQTTFLHHLSTWSWQEKNDTFKTPLKIQCFEHRGRKKIDQNPCTWFVRADRSVCYIYVFRRAAPKILHVFSARSAGSFYMYFRCAAPEHFCMYYRRAAPKKYMHFLACSAEQLFHVFVM